VKARDRGPQIKAITIATFSISWSFYLTRMATRTLLNVGVLGLDDLFLSLSMVGILFLSRILAHSNSDRDSYRARCDTQE
jgi:hypothetical protein